MAHAATWNLFVYLIHHLYILIYPSVDHQYSGPIKMRLILDQLKYHTCRLIKLTIGSYVSMYSSRYEARRKFREHERVAQGIAESNSSFLSALQTSQVLHISMNTQLTYEQIVL